MTCRALLMVTIALSCCQSSSAQDSNVEKVVEEAKDAMYQARLYGFTKPKEMKALLEQVLLKLKSVHLSRDQQRYVVDLQEWIAVLDRPVLDNVKSIIIEEDWDRRPIILRPLPRGKVPERKLKSPLPKEDGMPELFRDLCWLAQRELRHLIGLRDRQNR